MLLGWQGALAQVTTTEVEPNDSKASANPVSGMASGDRLAGITTGAAGGGGGSGSADYFRLRPAAAARAVYRYRLMLITAGTVGHAGSLRGLPQAAGVIGPGDTGVQNSSPGTSPPRFNQWYGFGRSEPLFYRVTGTAATTSPYLAMLERQTITPVVIADVIPEGVVTISTLGQGHDTDTEVMVYDGDLNPVPGFANDDESLVGGGPGTTAQSLLRRVFTPGTYFLAIADRNTAGSLGSPADDRSRDQPVVDLDAGGGGGSALVCSSTAVSRDVSFSIITPLGASQISAMKSGPFDIQWFQFTVAPSADPAPPTGFGYASPASVVELASSRLTVSVAPGLRPQSTGLAVTVDASSLAGPSTLELRDDGLGADATAGDSVYSAWVQAAAPQGQYTLPFTVTDGEGRWSTGSIAMGVTPGPTGACCEPAGCVVTHSTSRVTTHPTGACCEPAGCVVTREVLCVQAGGVFRGAGVDCGGVSYSVATISGGFEDLSAIGEAITLDDETLVDAPIGFAFRFFGEPFSLLTVCSNGYVQFGGGFIEFQNAPIPSPTLPNNIIAGLWDDLDPSAGGQAYVATLGPAGSRRFIVSFQDVPQFLRTDANTFQIVLFEGSNRIQIRYAAITSEAVAGDYSVGLENADGTIGTGVPGGSLGSGQRVLEFTPMVRPSPCSCSIDLNDDGNVDPDDLSDAIARFFDPAVMFDYDASGFEDPDDLASYITDYFTPDFCG